MWVFQKRHSWQRNLLSNSGSTTRQQEKISRQQLLPKMLPRYRTSESKLGKRSWESFSWYLWNDRWRNQARVSEHTMCRTAVVRVRLWVELHPPSRSRATREFPPMISTKTLALREIKDHTYTVGCQFVSYPSREFQHHHHLARTTRQTPIVCSIIYLWGYCLLVESPHTFRLWRQIHGRRRWTRAATRRERTPDKRQSQQLNALCSLAEDRQQQKSLRREKWKMTQTAHQLLGQLWDWESPHKVVTVQNVA